MMLFFDRQYDAAIDRMQKAIALAPDLAQQHNGLARAYAAKGAFADAIREIEQAIRLSGAAPSTSWSWPEPTPSRATGEGTRDRRGPGKEGQDLSREKSPVMYAWVYAALGDKERALRLLDQGSRAPVPSMLWLNVDPRVDSLRDDPRFGAIVRRLGIPER